MTSVPVGQLTDTDFISNTYRFAVSREFAVDNGLVEPTDEERAAAVDALRAYDARNRDLRALWVAAWPALWAAADVSVVVAAVLRLHAPIAYGEHRRDPVDRSVEVPPRGVECSGDHGREDDEYWPCDTVHEVARAVGVDLPSDVPGELLPYGPVRAPLPWPRPQIRDLFPSSFVNLDGAHLFDTQVRS